ncbi:hypothetical protein [Paenibacillus thalictri]|uniref:Uncharacterized protein n=1 Tax=Paenibacillus thalictri TaxID=2527873 RepID=A0A4Q9DU18_9BACL|nr:hypothetical protein [Paenibacillus thalictri]TBL79725.1 hypothetical protein EYB31_08930 [Paenibacillus thalictri]
MNLADMLSYADIQELSRIAENYDCNCNGHSKNELIQSILTKVSRREVFEGQIESLQLEDVRFLNSILFDPRNSFSLEELVARVQQSKFQKEEGDNWNPREMITKFKRRGWLFNGYSQQTRYLFQIPEDLKKRFGDVLAKHFRRNLTTLDEPGVYRDEQQLLIDDIYYFLQFVYKQPVALTAENYMYKRSLQQVLEHMSVKEEPVGKTAWRFGYGRMFREYPSRFSFIYDYCYYQELIGENDQVLSLTELGRSRIEQGHKEDLLQVYRFWLRLYKNPIPNLQAMVHWIERLTPAWTTYETLKEALSPLIRSYYYDSPESILEWRIVQMMMHLGLLRIGEDEKHGKVVRMTKLGSGVIHGTYVAEDDKVHLPEYKL